jgi:hypothetical protein
MEDLIEAACARSLSSPPPSRAEVEKAVVDWYEDLGLAAPSLVLWASSPHEATSLMKAVAVARHTLRDGGDALTLVSVFEALTRVLAPLGVDRLSDIAETAARRADAFTTVRDRYTEEAEAFWFRVNRRIGIDAHIEIDRLVFERVGVARTGRLTLVGDALGWYETESGDPRPGWHRPMGMQWFTPESLDVSRALGVEDTERWQPWTVIARGTFAFWPLADVIVLCEPPVHSSLDVQGRPHSETGPALEWADGSAFHAWHGTLVPRSLIAKPWPSRAVMLTRNAEVRRCAIERIGWDVYIAEMGFERLGEAVPDPGNPGFDLELYHVPRGVVGSMHARILICTNASVERDGTRRRFGLSVPPHVADPLAAVAWTFGLDARDYDTLAVAS